MTPTKLIDYLYLIGAIKFGNFTLKTGAPTPIYLDVRQVVSYPIILKAVADAMWSKIAGCDFDIICGVPYTAVPIATCISLTHNVPMVLRRKELKLYGNRKQIEGKFEKGQTCLILEDVITTGSGVLDTANELQVEGLVIKDVVTLINREQEGEKKLQQREYNLHCIFTLKEILHYLIKANVLSEPEKYIVTKM